MSDYTYSANLAAKDNLASGDTNKKILGATLETEFEAVETAIASKVDEDLTGYTEDTAPDGSADYMVTYDNSATAAKKVLLRKGSAKAWLQTNSPSGTASSVFDNLLTSVYDVYILEISNLTVANDQQDIRIQVGTGATPTYQTSTYQYSKMGGGSTAATVSTETSDAASDNITSGIILSRLQGNAGAVGNAAGESFSATVKIYNASSATEYKHMIWHASYADSLGRISLYTGAGMWKTTTAITSLKVYTGTGGNMTGTISLYGIRK